MTSNLVHNSNIFLGLPIIFRCRSRRSGRRSRSRRHNRRRNRVVIVVFISHKSHIVSRRRRRSNMASRLNKELL